MPVTPLSNSPAPVRVLEQIKLRVRPYLDLIFPRVCHVCQHPMGNDIGEAICSQCLTELEPAQNVCGRCCAPTRSLNLKVSRCRFCKSSWEFRRAYCMCIYQGVPAKVARQMKSGTNAALTHQVAALLAAWFHDQLYTTLPKKYAIDVIVPISQHWLRHYREHYNQAEILASEVSRTLNKPMHRKCLKRTKWVEKQGTKTIQERLRSMNGTMRVDSTSTIKNKAILVVDDILTSGATASEAARALKAAGAKSVDVLTFARGASSKGP